MEFALLGLLLLFNPNAEPMSKQDMYLEGAYMALHVADWGQTRDIAMRPQYWEVNPIIGRQPTVKQVDEYMITSAILHAGVVKSLPKKYRTHAQMITIGIKAGFVRHNARIGLKVNF
jgi:hypothetical protein